MRMLILLLASLSSLYSVSTPSQANSPEHFHDPLGTEHNPFPPIDGRGEVTPLSPQGRPEQAVGFYSNGSLLSPDELTASGPGWLKLFLLRDRAWATTDLIEIIQGAAKSIAEAFPKGERLQIGDFGVKSGGKITRHASHQNGLDADVAYLRRNHWEQDPDHGNGFEEVFVKDGALTANFDIERNWELVKYMVGTGQTGRIFMDAVIKKTFCQLAASRGELGTHTETLRRLRPLEGHADHLHLRILCPADSPRCVGQEPPPAGDGCNEV